MDAITLKHLSVLNTQLLVLRHELIKMYAMRDCLRDGHVGGILRIQVRDSITELKLAQETTERAKFILKRI